MLRTILRALGALLPAATMANPALAGKDETKLHGYGHAAWKITTPSGGVIMIDPWLTAPTNPDKNSMAELGRVDYILITHGHNDHVRDAVEIADAFRHLQTARWHAGSVPRGACQAQARGQADRHEAG